MQVNLKDARVLVTGGAGALGSTLVDLLLEQGARVTVVDDFSEGRSANLEAAGRYPLFQGVQDLDLASPERWELLVPPGTDYVLHTAGHLLLKSQADPGEAVRANVMATVNVLEAARVAGVKKLVFTSSISIYGEPRYTPVDEDHPLDNTTTYGATKVAGEHLCRDYGKRGVAFSIIRPSNIYGPRQSPKNGAFSQVVPRWIRAILNGEPLQIQGTGEQSLDLVHYQDMARAHLLALTLPQADGLAFNIGSGISTTVKELAVRLTQLMEVPDHPIQYDPGHDGNRVKKRCVDITRARTVLGYQPQYSLEAGLQETISWWKGR